jgi:hypothetical protein
MRPGGRAHVQLVYRIAKVGLELFSDEPDRALLQVGSPVRDELEPLDGVNSHWTSNPAGVVLLVRNE